MLVDVNRYEKWREIFGRPAPDPRMRDIELIARFLALYERAEEYTKPMKQFLNSFMARHQRDRDVSALKDRFTDTVDRVHGSLGARPFHVRRGINAAVFDSVMVAFARSPGSRAISTLDSESCWRTRVSLRLRAQPPLI